MLSRRRCFHIFALAVLGFFAPTGVSQASLQVLLTTGQSSPDGNGIFVDLGTPALNDRGDLVFSAALSNTIGGTTDDGGIFRLSTAGLQAIVRENQPVPDGNGRIDQIGSPSLNAAGEVAIRPTLRGTSGGTTDNQAIYRSTPGSPLTKIVRLGDADPNPQLTGNFTGLSGVTMADDGQVVFYSTLSGPSGGTGGKAGVFSGNGSSFTEIVRANQPSGIDERQIIFISQPAANASGQVAFGGNLDRPGDMHIGDGFALYRANGASSVPLVIKQESTINGLGTIDGYWSPVRINNAGMIAFRGLVDTPTSVTDRGGWFIADDAGVRPIVLNGQLLPTGDGNVEFPIWSNNYMISLNDLGQVVFRASLVNTPGGEADNRAIMVGDGTIITQIARTGQPVPGGNGIFSGFSESELINNNGAVAFRAGITQTASGVAESGLYLHLGNKVHEVARTGQQLDGSTIVSFSSRRGGAQSSALNNWNQLAFTATLADGREAIALFMPSASLEGDFNHDGVVDAADYVLWRKSPNDYGGLLDGYDTWQSNFGQQVAASSANSTIATIPEPAAISLLMAGACAVHCRYRFRAMMLQGSGTDSV